MILKDSKYNSTLIKEAYENDPENENLLDIALTNGAGCITGAYMSGGGAVRLFKNSRFCCNPIIFHCNKYMITTTICK